MSYTKREKKTQKTEKKKKGTKLQCLPRLIGLHRSQINVRNTLGSTVYRTPSRTFCGSIL